MSTMVDKKHLPIGVFDSGVGGLTVLRALQQALPGESFLYLGDTARVPYGTKSPDTIVRYSREAAEILIHRGIKLLVIACNTASALALPSLQQEFPEIPIIGVLEPGAQAACLASKKGYIAVIATEATVNAGGYQKAIKKIRPEARVVAKGCSLFVALAEEGWTSGDIPEAVARRYLESLLLAQADYTPDCLVLGCTHFPILLEPIKNVIAAEITIIDSAQSTAETVAKTLQELSLRKLKQDEQTLRFLVTDAPERFVRIAQLFLGRTMELNQLELVDLQHK